MVRSKEESNWSSSSRRSTRGKGDGGNKGQRRSTLTITPVSPTGKTSNSRPTIQATVRDEEASLSRDDINLYLDGNEKRSFSYGRASGRLRCRINNALSPGTHTVEIEAVSENRQGRSKSTARKRWTFQVSQ